MWGCLHDGVPYRTILGVPGQGGGSIFVNGNLRFSGNVEIAIDPDLGERVYVAGEVVHNAGARVTLQVGSDRFTLLPSNAPNFTTANGLYRDGRPTTAADGYPRAIAYLEPPRMDTVDPATDLPRYVAATRESGVWRQRPNGVWFNTGQYGYGRGIYINNALDIQQESRGFLGGYTLRGDWVNPGKSRYWNGPFYEPPGVFIELVEVLNPDGSVRAQGFRITRNQAEPRDVWYNPITGLPTNLKTMNFFFRNPNNPNDPTLTSEITQGDTSFDVPFNGVIYAEGNVRVKGRIPSGRQIIIVTNGTAYIEGNIVKGDERSALAILAKDYVCINTTQFLQRTFDSPASAQGDPTNVEAPYFFEVLPDQPMRLLFSFGEDPTPVHGQLWRAAALLAPRLQRRRLVHQPTGQSVGVRRLVLSVQYRGLPGCDVPAGAHGVSGLPELREGRLPACAASQWRQLRVRPAPRNREPAAVAAPADWQSGRVPIPDGQHAVPLQRGGDSTAGHQDSSRAVCAGGVLLRHSRLLVQHRPAGHAGELRGARRTPCGRGVA
jgi:hypothetical protein